MHREIMHTGESQGTKPTTFLHKCLCFWSATDRPPPPIWNILSSEQPHCKDKIPKFWNKYSQKRNIGVSVPISTFMRLWVIYIFPWSVCLFCWRKYVDQSSDYINRSQTVEIGPVAALFPCVCRTSLVFSSFGLFWPRLVWFVLVCSGLI